MEEAFVVNVFLWIRVFLVGGIFILFPRIARKGLLFGVYVGESFAGSDEARALIRDWDRGCLLVMVSALLVGLVGTLAGYAVPGNLTGTAVLLLGAGWLYFRFHAKVMALPRPDVTPQSGRATAGLQVGPLGGEDFAKVSLAICIVAAVATIIYALVNLPNMGDRMPSLWSLIGGAEAWTEPTLLTVMYVPAWNLFAGPLFAILALMVSSAKRSLREGPGSRSAEAQDAFRAANAKLFGAMALFICAILTVFSIQVVRIGRGETDSLGAGIFGIMILMILCSAGGLFHILRRYGQGGALLEGSDEEGALTGALADNEHWHWGVFYFNRDDPSMMVESRFGIGYSTNFGNWKAATFTVVALTLLLDLIVVGIVFV